MIKRIIIAVGLILMFQGISLADMVEVTNVQIVKLTDPTDSTNYRLIIKGDIPTIPLEMVIDSVIYELNIDYAVLKLSATAVQVPNEKLYAQAVAMKVPWKEDNVKWETTKHVDEQYAVTDLISFESIGTIELQLDMTELFRAWITDVITNNGFVLRTAEDLPSLFNSNVMPYTPNESKLQMIIYFTYNPK